MVLPDWPSHTMCCPCAGSPSGSPSLWLINTLTQDTHRLLSADQLTMGCPGTLCTAPAGTKTPSKTLNNAVVGTQTLPALRRLAQAGSPATNCCQHSITAPQVGRHVTNAASTPSMPLRRAVLPQTAASIPSPPFRWGSSGAFAL